MNPPVLAAEIERRLLLNYRADADVAAAMLPAGLRPHLVDGSAVVGVCLLRLGSARPRGMPAAIGLRSENAAHRVAVEWDGPEGLRHGVYVPRRDSDSLTNVLVGGRLYPGVHHRARFDVTETDRSFTVSCTARDGSVAVEAEAEVTPSLTSSLFGDLGTASAFFAAGSVGFSPTRDGRGLEGLELRTDCWSVEAVHVTTVRSTFLADPARFPAGSIEFDCGLLMRRVPVTWHQVAGASLPVDDARVPA